MTGAIELLVPKSMGIEIKISPMQKSRYKQKNGDSQHLQNVNTMCIQLTILTIKMSDTFR